MVLPENVPDEANQTATTVLVERLPNYCHECGGEIVIAGGRINPESGFYEHLDPVAMCERGCWQDRFCAGVKDDGAEGREYRQIADDAHDGLFPAVTGYCDIHRERMVTTKDLYLTVSDGSEVPVRQYKCPECDRETTVTTVEEADV